MKRGKPKFIVSGDGRSRHRSLKSAIKFIDGEKRCYFVDDTEFKVYTVVQEEVLHEIKDWRNHGTA